MQPAINYLVPLALLISLFVKQIIALTVPNPLLWHIANVA